ncbi:DUF4097 family beta strand repeat-containing protein [Phytohabitans houttuyneae]|uniref:DUF4097 domain-containing protein n=1 Tax=Phytohabitans houttuyneae TaxID=1076126 RepID=A0A6V8KFS4_9ACTN|nr:DUF4097 family beta strand repeat-containing protein [Phytohabitans houttuyneae]GFJ81228.1 hypothetical protein Phou_054080 [Phytohabitans houttuyneae]
MPTFATPEPITATLTTAGAEVRIAASDRLDTVVRVQPINRESASDVKVAEKTKVEFADGELTIKTTKSGDKNGSVAITVELPAGSRLALYTAWSDVHADGALGDCELNMSSGQVHLDRIAAVRGDLSTGGVTIGHIAGTATFQGGAADVRIGEVGGVLKYQGSNGKVSIGRALSDIDLNGANGSFTIDRADGSVIAKAAKCPIRIGQLSRGEADLANASGGIEIGVSEGTSAAVDARSTKGAVHNSLPAQDSPAQAGEHVKIFARTRLDDIVIHRATA